jgi:CheY-like chemotaxis protein
MTDDGCEVILLVEDEDALRQLVRHILEGRGYRVHEARNGREGLAVCATHDGRIDLLLTDVSMPELGGRELARGARELRPEVKVIFMSGHAPDLAPIQTFLQKPFTSRALTQKVRETLDSSRVPAGL